MIYAVEKLLTPIDKCSWCEDDYPLSKRGIRFQWLYNFVATIDSSIVKMWQHFRSNLRISELGMDIPDPEIPPYPEQPLTTRELVSKFIAPCTLQLQCPLFARVPIEHRGKPDVFISHTWNSHSVAGAHGSLDIVLDHYRDAFVWIDIGCYNQHTVNSENIAADMNSLIGDIGEIAFILTSEPFYTRSWCLWEIVCGHKSGARVRVYDQIARIQRKYWSSEAHFMPPKFTSIQALTATEQTDQDAILELLIRTFGSISNADEYINGLLAKP